MQVLSVLYGLTLLVLAAFWFSMLIGVSMDAKDRDPARAPFWIALVLFFGPLGVLAWVAARPDLPPSNHGPG